MKMNDKLLELCNNIERCQNDLCEKNRIVCVKKSISEFVSGDRNQYLWIKAQIEIHRKFKESTIPVLSILISVFSFLCSIVSLSIMIAPQGGLDINTRVYIVCGILVIMIVALAIFIIENKSNKKYSSVDKILEYIAVVLDDMDKNDKIS